MYIFDGVKCVSEALSDEEGRFHLFLVVSQEGIMTIPGHKKDKKGPLIRK